MDDDEGESDGVFSRIEQLSDYLQHPDTLDLSDDQQLSNDYSLSDESSNDSEHETGSDESAVEDKNWDEDRNGDILEEREKGQQRPDTVIEVKFTRGKEQKSCKSAPPRMRKINSMHRTNDSSQKNAPQFSWVSNDGYQKRTQRYGNAGQIRVTFEPTLQNPPPNVTPERKAGRNSLKPAKHQREKASKGKSKALARRQTLQDGTERGRSAEADIEDRDSGVTSTDTARRSPLQSPLFHATKPVERSKKSWTRRWTRPLEDDVRPAGDAVKRVTYSADHRKRRSADTEEPDDRTSKNCLRSRSSQSPRKKGSAGRRGSDARQQNSSRDSIRPSDTVKKRSGSLAGRKTATRVASGQKNRLQESQDQQERKDEETKHGDIVVKRQTGHRPSSTVPRSRGTVSAGSAFVKPSPLATDPVLTGTRNNRDVGEYKPHPSILPKPPSDRSRLAHLSSLSKPRSVYNRPRSAWIGSRSSWNGFTYPESNPPGGAPQLQEIKANAPKKLTSSNNSDLKPFSATRDSSDNQPHSGRGRLPFVKGKQSTLSATPASSLSDTLLNRNQNAQENESDGTSSNESESEQIENSERRESVEKSELPVPVILKKSFSGRSPRGTHVPPEPKRPKRIERNRWKSICGRLVGAKQRRPGMFKPAPHRHRVSIFRRPRKKSRRENADTNEVRNITPETAVSARGAEPTESGVSRSGSDEADTHITSHGPPRQVGGTTSRIEASVHPELEADVGETQEEQTSSETSGSSPASSNEEEETAEDEIKNDSSEEEGPHEMSSSSILSPSVSEDGSTKMEKRRQSSVGFSVSGSFNKDSPTLFVATSFDHRKPRDQELAESPDSSTDYHNPEGLLADQASEPLRPVAHTDHGKSLSLSWHEELQGSSAEVDQAQVDEPESFHAEMKMRRESSLQDAEASTSSRGSQNRLMSFRSLFELCCASGSMSRPWVSGSDVVLLKEEAKRKWSDLRQKVKSKLLRVKQSQHCGSGFGSSEDPRTAMSIGSVSSHVRQEQRTFGKKDEQINEILAIVHHLAKAEKREISRRRWSNALRLVFDMCYIARVMSLRSYDLSMEYPTFVDIGDYALGIFKANNDAYINTKLLKVTGQKHELFLTAEMKLTLMSRPEERSPKQLAQVLLSLQSIDAFCDYPLHTQQTVARLAFYERCGAKRVVIRQGHHPQHVYIILSGQALVSEKVERERGVLRETRALLSTGQVFGERAVISKSVRTSTVTTRTDMQLLLISKQDFISIFVPEGLKDGVPDFIKYLSTRSWLQGWPWEEFLKNRSKCFTHYYRHRCVIVADSESSDYVYVIRHGSCRVLMLVDGLKTTWKDVEQIVLKEFIRLNQSTGVKVPEEMWRSLRPRRRPVSASDRKQSFFPPPSRRRPSRRARRESERTSKVFPPLSSTLQSSAKVTMQSPREDALRASNSYNDSTRSDHDRSSFGDKYNSGDSVRSSKPRLRLDVSAAARQRALDLDEPAVKGQSSPEFEVSAVIEQNYLALDESAAIGQSPRRFPDAGVIWREPCVASSSSRSVLPSSTPVIVPCPPPPHGKGGQRPDKEPLSTWARRRQYQVPQQCRPRHRPRPHSAPTQPSTDSKVFVELQVLSEGDVFGLDQLELSHCHKLKSHKVSLVSNGAEVIAINKQLLARHANPAVQQAIHLYAGNGYPSPQEVQHSCRMLMAWELYKDKMKDELQHHLDLQRPNHGIYFQPGPLIHPLAAVGFTADTR